MGGGLFVVVICWLVCRMVAFGVFSCRLVSNGDGRECVCGDIWMRWSLRWTMGHFIVIAGVFEIAYVELVCLVLYNG